MLWRVGRIVTADRRPNWISDMKCRSCRGTGRGYPDNTVICFKCSGCGDVPDCHHSESDSRIVEAEAQAKQANIRCDALVASIVPLTERVEKLEAAVGKVAFFTDEAMALINSMMSDVDSLGSKPPVGEAGHN